MFRIASILILILISSSVFCQNDSIKRWKITGNGALNFTQSLYNNWSAGGENSFAGAAKQLLSANYKKNKLYWDNNLELGYGLLFQGKDETTNNKKISKTDDRIILYSKVGYQAYKNWNYTTDFRFQTQFDKGYSKYPVLPGSMYSSKFMAPATILTSIGLDYKIDKNPDQFSLGISPVAAKITIVNDDSLSNAGAYGVTPGKHIFSEYGAKVNMLYLKKLHENIDMRFIFVAFSNLLHNPGNIDINSSIEFRMKVTKLISAHVAVNYLYDDDTKNTKEGRGPASQIQQVLGVGLAYNF